jgi:hypothetical protein
MAGLAGRLCRIERKFPDLCSSRHQMVGVMLLMRCIIHSCN